MVESVKPNKITTPTPIPSAKGIHFFKCVGHCAVVTGSCLCDFYIMLQNMDASTIKYYLQRGDLQKWLLSTPGVKQLAKPLSALSAGLSEENLKQELLSIVQGAATELKKRC